MPSCAIGTLIACAWLIPAGAESTPLYYFDFRFSAFAFLAPLPPPATQDSAPPVLRVAGPIIDSQTWSGRVWITGDTMFDNATVSVEPGTNIEFCGTPDGDGPVLRFGLGKTGQGLLKLAGTADRPITIATHEGTPAGRIEGGVSDGAALHWAHVRFARLGERSDDSTTARKRRLKAALLLTLGGRAATASIDDVEFSRCARVSADIPGEGSLVIQNARFSDSLERSDIDVRGEGSGSFQLSGSRLDGAVRVVRSTARIEGNVLIGDHACIALLGRARRPSRVTDNYVHCTAVRDDGHYAATFEDPDTEAAGNVLRGGTYVIVQGSRMMHDNVLLAAERLESPIVKNSRTHHLVSELPGGARFLDNILIGPAFSLVCTTGRRGIQAAPVTDVRIERCVFDGRGATGRAIHLNRDAREQVAADISRCLFIDVTAAVFDESHVAGAIARMGRNAFAPPSARNSPTASAPAASADDVTAASLADLKLAGPLPVQTESWDGPTRVAVHAAMIGKSVFAAYDVAPESPVMSIRQR